MQQAVTIFQHSQPNASLTSKTRRRLLLRANDSNLPPFKVTQRDIAIIYACYEYRALSTTQLQQLFFQNSNNNRSQYTHCQHRLKCLYHHGYIYRDEQKTRLTDGRRPLIYFLDTKGAALLAECMEVAQSELDWRPKDNVAGAGHLFLEHLLKTNDIRIALVQAVSRANATIEKWYDDKVLKSKQMKEYVNLKDASGKTQRVALVPDGYFSLSSTHGPLQHHFIEADLRTMVGQAGTPDRRDWKRKIQVYLAFHSQKIFRERYGARSFRVLTVTTGQGRLDNLKRITEEAGGKNRFWFTTYDQLCADSVLTRPIWQIANREGKYALLEDGSGEDEPGLLAETS